MKHYEFKATVHVETLKNGYANVTITIGDWEIQTLITQQEANDLIDDMKKEPP